MGAAVRGLVSLFGLTGRSALAVMDFAELYSTQLRTIAASFPHHIRAFSHHRPAEKVAGFGGKPMFSSAFGIGTTHAIEACVC
jgi:hypothetical protein